MNLPEAQDMSASWAPTIVAAAAAAVFVIITVCRAQQKKTMLVKQKIIKKWLTWR